MKKGSLLFVGHGSPMNALENNRFALRWEELGKTLPRPEAILSVSAHWETRGTRVTVMEQPETIHDFGGFPEALFRVKYPAPGSPSLAEEIIKLYPEGVVSPDERWGLDHGTWSVLCRMVPGADIPVVQFSLDRNLTAAEHYTLARGLAPLRDRNILILGSGNMVHNLGEVRLRSGDFNEPYGFPWALEADELFRRLLTERNHGALCGYEDLGASVRKAIPTPEHFLPLLYVLALSEPEEVPEFFNSEAVGGSLTMTSVQFSDQR